MGLARGETLEQRLKRDKQLPPPIVERLLDRLLDGLEEVHKTGFLHRDIKPANIILDAKDNPTLIDFGASRASMADRTAALTAIFTPRYAAAEQLTSDKQGPWTDIYSVSATLYHAITGRPPPSSLERALNDSYEPLTELLPAGFSAEHAATDRCGSWRCGQRTGRSRSPSGVTVLRRRKRRRDGDDATVVEHAKRSPHRGRTARPVPPPARTEPRRRRWLPDVTGFSARIAGEDRIDLLAGVTAVGPRLAVGGYLVFAPSSAPPPPHLAIGRPTTSTLRGQSAGGAATGGRGSGKANSGGRSQAKGRGRGPAEGSGRSAAEGGSRSAAEGGSRGPAEGSGRSAAEGGQPRPSRRQRPKRSRRRQPRPSRRPSREREAEGSGRGPAEGSGRSAAEGGSRGPAEGSGRSQAKGGGGSQAASGSRGRGSEVSGGRRDCAATRSSRPPADPGGVDVARLRHAWRRRCLRAAFARDDPGLAARTQSADDGLPDGCTTTGIAGRGSTGTFESMMMTRKRPKRRGARKRQQRGLALQRRQLRLLPVGQVIHTVELHARIHPGGALNFQVPRLARMA